MNIPYAFSRRTALGGALGLATAALVGCGGEQQELPSGSAGGDPWKQFSGTTINFISENTSPSAAIAANLAPFRELTGITVNVQQMELDKVVEKVKLDFSSGSAQNHVIYADPYQILAPLADGLADLTAFINSDKYPKLENGVQDFIPTQLQAAGKFIDDNKIYALPYDCPTMIWHYRLDLFEKYRDRMRTDLGFDPMPSDSTTWEQYYAIADWFNRNAKSDVKFGTGHQAKQHDSLMCDFSNVLWAYGGDYFSKGQEVGLLGVEDPGQISLDSPQAVEAMTFYKKLVKIAHPSSTSWDWNGLGDAFAAGEVAMCPNWHEFAAGEEKQFPGKVGYAPLPRGPKRSANIYGGTGIGINRNAQGNELGAAWLFVNWATSPQTQLMSLGSSVGGGTPTRTSVYDLPEVTAEETKSPSKYPNIRTAAAVQKAWQSDYIGLRPKVSQWVQLDTIIFTELSKMLTADGDPGATIKAISDQMQKAMG
ncbi:ABC transporter substrate-binding protein [Enemella evansiae]|uniref:ABC transporter substrate-binding protein n=1 Tax=Enemella evansiae TaxID=2016499 RepID=UPI00105D93D5|nr:extracellular solute-binding protein [Enemella evansiae]TDO89884.1 carbohydrate ABC transporter substrate-binding protein (CUT1 family) [Enemella evansiae]